MILVVNLCREKMHELEFVKPVCDILATAGREFSVKDYFHLKRADLNAAKIILCGTSLMDFDYLKNTKVFEWVKKYRGDLMGICGGMQVIAHLYGGGLYKDIEIGKIRVELNREFFSMPQEFFAYSSHTLGVRPPRGFEIVAESSQGVEIIRRIEEEGGKRMILGVLFHPEVLNKEIIEGFVGW